MKKTVVLGLAMAFTTSGIFAQAAATAPASNQSVRRLSADDMAKREADRMNTAAQLSPDQYTKVVEVFKNFITQREALRSPGGDVTEEQRNKYKALNQERDTKLKAILTPEQWEKAQAARRPAKMNGANAQPRPQAQPAGAK